jgi:hypothetical protein
MAKRAVFPAAPRIDHVIMRKKYWAVEKARAERRRRDRVLELLVELNKQVDSCIACVGAAPAVDAGALDPTLARAARLIAAIATIVTVASAPR